MSKQSSETRNEVDEEPEEGEIQDDEGSLEDVSSDDEIPSIVKRQKSEVYARCVRLQHDQFAKIGRQQLSSTTRREMRLCSSQKSDSALKKRQASPRSGSRSSGTRISYFEGQRYKSLKELIQKVSGKVHEKENKVKDTKKARRRSASFHTTGSEQRGTSEYSEPYFSSTSTKGSWHKGDIKEKHKKKKKNSKINKTNNPLVEVYESQLKSTNASSSVDTRVKSTVNVGVGSVVHQKEIELEKEKPTLTPSPASSDIVVLEVPVTVPEVITILDSDEEVLKKEKEKNSETQMTAAKEEDKGSMSDLLPLCTDSRPVKVPLENDTDDNEDNLKFLREAALNSSKPEKCVNVNRDDEVLQLRWEALRSAIIRKYEERKKRGITVAKSSKISSQKHVMSISPLGSPNLCSSGDSSNHVDEVDPYLSLPSEIIASSNYHESFDRVNDSEIDKISTVDMELAESDEEGDQVHTESRDDSNCRTSRSNVESEASNTSKVDKDTIEREPDGSGSLICSTDEQLPSAPFQNVSSPSVPSEISEAPLGYIIGDQEQPLDFTQEIHETVSPPVHFLLDSQTDVHNGNKVCESNVEGLLPDERLFEVMNIEQIPSEEKQNDTQCSLGDEATSLSREQAGHSIMFDVGSAVLENDEILDIVSGRSDISYSSALSGELDLDSMIVLDEVGRCSYDAKSESSEGGISGLGELQNSVSEDTANNSENCNSEDNAELCDRHLGVNFSSLLCNSQSSSEIVQSNSDNYEASEDNIEVFEDVSISMTPVVGNVHISTETLSACKTNFPTLEEQSHIKLDVTSSSSRDSVEVSLHKNVDDLMRLELHNKSENVPIQEESVVSSFPHCDTIMRVDDKCNQNNVNTEDLNVPGEVSTFSSEESEKSLVNCDDYVRENSFVSTEKVFSSVCKDTAAPASLCEEQVPKPGQDENPCCTFQQKENTQSAVNVCNTESGENIASNNENSTEDEETLLRVSLLAMLKIKTDELKNKQKLEPSPSLKSDVGDNRHSSFVRKTDSNIKKVVSIVPLSSPRVTEFASHDPCRNDDKSYVSVLKPLSSSQSSAITQRSSSICSVSKNVYSSCNSPVSRLGSKATKHRVRDVKTRSIFNVNVPKLVINLGEDSDSGDEDKCEALESVPVLNIHGCDGSEESRDNAPGSQSVPPDFERKLDMLLKQARFQQEAHTREDSESLCENTNENLSNAGTSKTISLPSKISDIIVGKSLGLSSGSCSAIGAASVNKISSVVVEDAQKKSCSSTKGNKIMCNYKSVDVTKFSSRKAETNKQNIQVRAKHTSVAHGGPSVSSVVDIGFLSSCKQKEYMRLKKQLAQLARKETAIKTKENITLMNTSRLPTKKNVIEEGKLQASSALRSSAIKSSIVLNAERSPYTRKFVRRGPGGVHTLRNETGKSRRIVRTVSTSNNLQTHLRNRLTVTTPNRIGSASAEGSPLVRRVLCVPQKRIVTAVSGTKKVSSGIQVTTTNINVDLDDKPRNLCVNQSSENASTLENLPYQRKSKMNDDEHEKYIGDSVSSSSDDVQKVFIGKNVTTKRKGNNSKLCEEPVQKKKKVQDEYNDQTASESLFQTNTDSKSSHERQINEGNSVLSNSVQESSIGQSNSIKRKKITSDHNSGLEQEESVITHETSKEQTQCRDSSKDAEAAGIVDGTLSENLWSSENKLISKRYQVLEDIATVQLKLHEIKSVNVVREEIIRNIERLKEEMSIAETQLSKREELLKVLYSEVESAKRDIMKKQSETLLLSVECEEMGCKVHGSNYNIPYACTDLIRTGMGKISKALELLKHGKTAEPENEMPTLYSSGEPLPNETDTILLSTAENMEESSEDSSKQNSGSYLSPLEAIRPRKKPSDNLAVLCPYHIMGSCKDKECSYLH